MEQNISETKIPQKKGSRLASWRTVKILAALIVLAALAATSYWWFVLRTQVYTDDAHIYAPLIELSPSEPAVLKKVLVKEGDIVVANQPVARVGDVYLTATTGGLVVKVNNAPGTLFAPGTPIVEMVNPDDLRVDAKIPENGGFSSIHVGDNVTFTVDAFGSKQYHGVVDEIAKTAYQSSVVFSISDTRPTQDFEVKIKFDPREYPELLNGMSAKVWIHIS